MRWLIILLFLPALCFGQYRPPAKTNTNLQGKDGAGYGSRGHWGTRAPDCFNAIPSPDSITNLPQTRYYAGIPTTATVVISDLWIAQLEGGNFAYTIDPNTGAERKGYIYLTDGACKDTITIVQEAAPM